MSYHASQPETIQSLFDRIAKRYDLGNALCSMGWFRKWNRALVEETIPQDCEGPLLDLCAGTGDISFLALRRRAHLRSAHLLDFSSQMLEVARHKWSERPTGGVRVDFLEADAQAIPLEDSSVLCATQAYGIRNVCDPSLCMREVWRVLKPGGRWGILELTAPRLPLFRTLYRLYLRLALPLIGRVVSGDYEAYRYLSRSICGFMPPSEFSQRLEETGFRLLRCRSLFLGAAHLWVVEKRHLSSTTLS